MAKQPQGDERESITAQKLADVAKQLEKTKKKLAEVAKESAVTEDALAKIGSQALHQLGPIGMLANAVRALWKAFAEVPKVKVPTLPRADGIPVLKPAGGDGAGIGGLSTKAMGAIGAAIAVVGWAVQHTMGMVSGLKDTLVGLARAGFEGTVEMYRYDFSMKMLGREVAGALVPVLNLLTSIIKSVTSTIQSFGSVGQKALAAFVVGLALLTTSITVLTGVVAVLVVVGSPVAVVFFAIAAAMTAVGGAVYLAWNYSAGFRAAVLNLKSALGDLFTALEPVAGALLKIGVVLLQVFVVQPLINFLNVLAVIVRVLERAVTLATKLSVLRGFGGGASDDGKKTNVTLNQTGTESGEAMFQRIQQEILKLGVGDNDPNERTATATEGILAHLQNKTDDNTPSIPSARSMVEGVWDAIPNPIPRKGSLRRFGL
jgi:hypothetical protein